jgi:hypothetical protein
MTTDFFADLPVKKETTDFFTDLPVEEIQQEIPVEKAVPDFFADISKEEPAPLEEPKEESFFQRLGKAAAIRAQIEAPPETLPQLAAGTIEELSLGAIDVLKPKTPAGKFAREAGSFAIGFPVLMQGLGKLLKPVGWLGRLLGTGAAGGTRSAVKQYFKKGEINPKEVAKQGAIWGAIEGAIQGIGLGINTKRAIDFISKRTGKPKPEVARFLADKFASRFKKKFKAEPTPNNIQKMPPALVNEVVKDSVVNLEKEGLAKFGKVPEVVKEISKEKIPVIPEKSPEPTLKDVVEKDPLSEALLKDNRVPQVLNDLANKFDIERPFVKAGAPETGFRVKTYHVEINKNIDQGKVIQKEIKKIKLSKEEMGDLVLASELKTPPKDPKLKKAYDIATKYWADSLDKLKKSGVLKGGFIENQMDNIQDQIEERKADLKKKGITSKKRKNLAEDLRDLKNELDELKEMRFVSIPARLWFENEALRDPATFKRIIKFQTKKKRKTFRIKDLVDAGVIKKDDLNMNDIIDYYSRKLGRDLALANILNASKKEGLSSLESKKDFVKIPGFVAPELAKYWVHPAFADYLSVYTQPVPMNLYDKLARISKGYAFYNPMFIPMYDIVQQIPLLLSNLKSLPKMPRIYKKSIQEYFKKTPEYWQAYEDGLFSNIFVPESAILKDYTKKLPADQNSPGINVIKKIAKLPVKLHNKFYDAVQSLTWGMDQVIRFTSYNLLKESGLTSRDAAQLAAQFHGDYAKMPPKTRRILNRFIFTPTFQSLMIRLPFTLAKGGGKVGKAILKGEKIPLKERKGLEALIGIAAVMAAIDLYLRDKDWKPDVWGYRYIKENPDNPSKENVLTVSHPFNVLIKWADILGSPFFDKSEDRMFWKIMNRLKFRSAIPVQIAWELIENKKSTGAPVVKPGDSAVVKTAKVMDHAAGRIFAIYGDWIKQERIGDPKAREFLKEDMGRLISSLPLFFTYMRSGEAARIYNKKVAIERKMIAELNRLARLGKEMSEEEKEKWRKAIREAK